MQAAIGANPKTHMTQEHNILQEFKMDDNDKI